MTGIRQILKKLLSSKIPLIMYLCYNYIMGEGERRVIIRSGGFERKIQVIDSKINPPQFKSEKPVGFADLTDGTIRNLLQYAGLSPDDPAQLAKLTPRQLRDLAFNQEKFGAGGSIASCIPDKGQAIRNALNTRVKLLTEASRQLGSNMKGLSPDEVEDQLGLIREALNGPDKPDKEEDFSF